jgi:hypothetical protein
VTLPAKEPRPAAVVIDGGPWGGQRGEDDPAPTEAEWVDRIAHYGTILNAGETLPWMKPVADRLWTQKGDA